VDKVNGLADGDVGAWRRVRTLRQNGLVMRGCSVCRGEVSPVAHASATFGRDR
jgi:hypothetical protein